MGGGGDVIGRIRTKEMAPRDISRQQWLSEGAVGYEGGKLIVLNT